MGLTARVPAFAVKESSTHKAMQFPHLPPCHHRHLRFRRIFIHNLYNCHIRRIEQFRVSPHLPEPVLLIQPEATVYKAESVYSPAGYLHCFRPIAAANCFQTINWFSWASIFTAGSGDIAQNFICVIAKSCRYRNSLSGRVANHAITDSACSGVSFRGIGKGPPGQSLILTRLDFLAIVNPTNRTSGRSEPSQPARYLPPFRTTSTVYTAGLTTAAPSSHLA